MIPMRLATMFMLQFAIWGVWSVPLGTYLTEVRHWNDIVGLAYGMQGIAAIIAPMLVGLLADRVIPAQKLMGCLYFAAAAFMFVLTTVTSNRFLFLAVLLGHFICFVPTLPLANTVGLTLIPNAKKNFPHVRAFGTLGWICVGLFVGLKHDAATSDLPLRMAAWGCVFAALYSFALPKVPPADKSGGIKLASLFGLEVLRRADSRNLRVLLIAALCAVVPLAFYYAYANVFLNQVHAHLSLAGIDAGPTALQTIYQMAELALLLPLPILIRQAGTGSVIGFGLVGWIASYCLFAFGQHNLVQVLSATALQGVSYSCLFTAGAIYIDAVCCKEDCAQAQSVFSTISLGLGPVAGALFASFVFARTQSHAASGWTTFWLIPTGMCGIALIYFVSRFRFGHAQREADGGTENKTQ